MSVDNETLMTKLERGRAEFAYNCVKESIEKLDEKRKKEYKSYSRKIPQMILSNGLGQTLAFIFSKKEKGNAYELIYKQITNYLRSNSTARIQIPNDNLELIEWVINLPSIKYMYVKEEILAFLNWLKKFAEGIIETEE